ncbi:Integrator complex subunit 2, partial [Lunasporangiospora selenospora]
MTTATSEAFRLIETGANPWLQPSLAGTVLKYLKLDYQLIQRQVKEELQLWKQNIDSTTSSVTTRFESGSTADRARMVLVELAKLQGFTESSAGKQPLNHVFPILSSSIYRSEVTIALSIITLQCQNPVLDIQTKAILLRLCKLADHRAWDIRQRLVDLKVFPNLAIELTIEHCHDETGFMNRILQGQPEWLINDSVDPVNRTSLTSIMEFVFSSLNDELISDRPDHVAINRLLRIVSGMIGLLNLPLTAEQLEISFGVLEMSPPEPSTVDIKVCLILMAAAQLLKSSESRVERILHALLNCEDSPQVLLLSIYFQTQQLLLIDDFASKVLSMTIVIPRTGLMELNNLFKTLFLDEGLSTCALRLGRPIISQWHSASSSRLLQKGIGAESGHKSKSIFGREARELSSVANLCVTHLLKHDVFHKSSTDVRSWMMEQIQASTVPLDSNLVPLLRAYTSAISRSEHITRIPENEIRAYFSNPCEDLTPAKALLVLYMLLNNETCTSNITSESLELNREYSEMLMEYVQIRKVLLYVQHFQGGEAFKTIQPMFLKLVNAQFPELFDVTTLLMEEGLETSKKPVTTIRPSTLLPPPPSAPSTPFGPPSTSMSLSLSASIPLASELSPVGAQYMITHFKALEYHLHNPGAALKAYHVFQRLPQADQQMMAGALIEASLPALLDSGSHPIVVEAFKKNWDLLNRLMPHELWALTIHALRPRPQQQQRQPPTAASAFPTADGFPGLSVAKPVMGMHAGPGKPFGGQAYPPIAHLQPQSQHPQDFYSFESLVQDPLLLFKVDYRVFRRPMIFRMFIQILGAVMVGSRHWFRKQFQAAQAIQSAMFERVIYSAPGHASTSASLPLGQPGAIPTLQFKEANLSAMLYIQDSTLIQLLLEICQLGPLDQQVEKDKDQEKQKRRPKHRNKRLGASTHSDVDMEENENDHEEEEDEGEEHDGEDDSGSSDAEGGLHSDGDPDKDHDLDLDHEHEHEPEHEPEHTRDLKREREREREEDPPRSRRNKRRTKRTQQHHHPHHHQQHQQQQHHPHHPHQQQHQHSQKRRQSLLVPHAPKPTEQPSPRPRTRQPTATKNEAHRSNEVLKEIRVVTFNFLHQLFIDHKIFPKLVHFQGYAMDLLPTTVEGISSIHVCLDFAHELLHAPPTRTLPLSGNSGVGSGGNPGSGPGLSISGSSVVAGIEPGNAGTGGGSAMGGGGGGVGSEGGSADDLTPQLFALRLAVLLCERFPLQTTMQMAVDSIMPKIRMLLTHTSVSGEVYESAKILCRAFPTMRNDVVNIIR